MACTDPAFFGRRTTRRACSNVGREPSVCLAFAARRRGGAKTGLALRDRPHKAFTARLGSATPLGAAIEGRSPAAGPPAAPSGKTLGAAEQVQARHNAE